MKIDESLIQNPLRQSAALLSSAVDPGAASLAPSSLQFPDASAALDVNKLAGALKLDAPAVTLDNTAKMPPELQAAMDAGVAGAYCAIALQAVSGAAKGCVSSLHRLLQGQ